MTEPTVLPTRREYLAGLTPPLAVSLEQAKAQGKRGGGRFSNQAKAKLAEAEAAGVKFSD